MKRNAFAHLKRNAFMRVSAVVCALIISWFGAGTLLAETQGWPATKPSVGNARLVVCGQNAYNYFVVDLTNSRCKYSTVAGLEERTQTMVQSLRYIDADIFAFNELENAGDTVLAYLTNALNTAAGEKIYAYISDDCTKQNNSEQIKSGFIYRTDKVSPLGTNHATTSRSYYHNTMRWQAFTERSTNEAFVLSMNHFKSKASGDDDGSSMRQNNANDLIQGLATITIDPDILVLGDMNCTITEDPLVYILNNGYEEQLLRYNASAYSYIYQSNKQLIDHAFANNSMATQVTGAGVFHVNTSSAWGDGYKYSDHDPYIVGLALCDETPDPTPDPTHDPEDCTDVADTTDFKNGLGKWTVNTVSGGADWYSNTSYGAVVNGKGRTAPQDTWLISPAFDLSGKESAVITFRHNLYYDNTNGKYKDYETLWITTTYDGASTLDTTAWLRLEIPTWKVKGYINCTVNIPAAYCQEGFRYAFRHTAESSDAANYWEIDNTVLTAQCKQSTTAVEQVRIDLRDSATRVYSITGVEMTAAKENLPAGLYILVAGAQTQKIIVR